MTLNDADTRAAAERLLEPANASAPFGMRVVSTNDVHAVATRMLALEVENAALKAQVARLEGELLAYRAKAPSEEGAS